MARGNVLVTGTSTGIGHATAVRLVREGFSVFAGVRNLEDGERLRRYVSGDLVPVRLDVTDVESIRSAAHEVEGRSDGRLAGLVNNAGIGLFGPLEYLPLEDLRRIFDVNVLGQIAVTQACLPLLRAGAGRVVNIGSVGDRIAFPFGGALNASKSALAALSEALRMELRPWGIHVVIGWRLRPSVITASSFERSSRGRLRASAVAAVRVSWRTPSCGRSATAVHAADIPSERTPLC
jgi:NAD(P)-dependent dehydrogenase (short-subunit alcohol dehydrogenase family)